MEKFKENKKIHEIKNEEILCNKYLLFNLIIK
jgi:hypothetical protein